MIHYIMIVSSDKEISFFHSFTPGEKRLSRSTLEQDINHCLLDAQKDKVNFIASDGCRKLVYRSFGSDIAIASIDSSDDLLQTFEFLNLFMCTLSQYFPNFSHHSILQNTHKIHIILQQMVIGGCIVETSPFNALSEVRLLDDALS